MSAKPQPKPKPEQKAEPQPKPKPEPVVAPAVAVAAKPLPEPEAAQVADESGPASDDAAAPVGAEQDDLKRKYREAMARKHGSTGASQKGHGDSGNAGPHSSGGPTQRMFRRKAGG